MYQIPLPDEYQQLTSAQATELIARRRDELADRMVILGHHYQRDEIIRFADYSGDSLELSRIAAKQDAAEFIVFCGVHFMAESADILSADNQKVLLPDMAAGCSMADMAELDQVETCWEFLKEQLAQRGKPAQSARLVPVTYVNSSADIKAFCGRHDGLCCTSSNCLAIFESIWQNDPEATVLFLPDQHLGRNTAYGMGVQLDEMALWDPFQAGGGIEQEQLARARIVLWDGFCSVHQQFTMDHISESRREDPNVKVIVHPECCFEVAQAADYVGSTAYIIKMIQAAESGSSWAVGTETNLVNRLATEMAQRDVTVRCLSPVACLCETMYRIDLPHLAWLLDRLAAYVDGKGELANRITVDEQTKQDARRALTRMLDVTATARA